MDFLKNIFSIFGKKEQSVLGIDIGSSAIKIVQIKKKKGRAVLETYGELALGPYGGTEIGRATNLTLEKTAQALTDILREAKTTTKTCGTALPLSSSLISFINVPATDSKQIGEIITLEARKYIPVPITEVLLDWSIIPKEDAIEDTSLPAGSQPPVNKGTSEVLVVAIHNESIANYQGLMAKTGLQSSFFEIELFSSLRAVLDQGIQANMVVDMGASTTKLYIIERGLLRTSHIINRGSQDITLAISKSLSIPVTEAENMKRVYGLTGGPEHKELTDVISLTLDYVFYEANRVMLGYQRKYNKDISKIILTGGGVLLKGFTELAKTSFQNNVVYADPFGKLETPAFLAEQFKTAGPEFAVAIGIALRRLSEIQ
ncbi:MAG: type IV pilus assembly protein PilM [Candidatus Taylorbacteria bacterium]|nr:type IV pilus assembly protein PilM [Candidatus Taylorbacteria bacterium]